MCLKLWMILRLSLIVQRSYSTSTSVTSGATESFIVHCNKQITRHGRSGNIVEAEALFHRMPRKSNVTYTAMLSAYAIAGQIDRSRKLFDEMPHRAVASWNAMITAYVKDKRHGYGVDEAYRLFLMMPERNAVSYSVMMMGFVNAGRIDEAQKLYADIPVNWRDPFCSNILMNRYLKSNKLKEAVQIFEGIVKKNVVSWSSMVDGYCKNGRIAQARKMFDSMGEIRNEFTWCSMIDGYMKEGSFKDGFQMFLQMRRENYVKIEPTIASVILDSCGRNGRYVEGCQVHGLVSHLGLYFDLFLVNSIIAMYSRFGYMNEAKKLFDRLSHKDVVSWNFMLHGYVLNGMLDEAYELFQKAELKDPASWTTMITGFATKGLSDKCIHLFNMMPERDDVAWTALISGFSNSEQYDEAFCWFMKMMENGVMPNPFTLSTLLSVSAGLAFLRLGQQIHAIACKMQMHQDLSVQNALISMYSKTGNVDEAYHIFGSIGAPNMVSFNSMITGFARNGFGKETLQVFKQLVDAGQHPNDVTFLCVLSACAHIGLVEEGRRYFDSMTKLFKIEPNPDHYACMVDILGKAGLLQEAKELIETMPVKPHSGVWGALLSASQIYMNLDLAKLAAQHISEIEQDNAAPYAVLSNICGFHGKRMDEEEVRLSKKLRGIRKSPGCSWIGMI